MGKPHQGRLLHKTVRKQGISPRRENVVEVDVPCGIYPTMREPADDLAPKRTKPSNAHRDSIDGLQYCHTVMKTKSFTLCTHSRTVESLRRLKWLDPSPIGKTVVSQMVRPSIMSHDLQCRHYPDMLAGLRLRAFRNVALTLITLWTLNWCLCSGQTVRVSSNIGSRFGVCDQFTLIRNRTNMCKIGHYSYFERVYRSPDR
ncbi:hypothetical protein CALVIDRAFT_329466 [Calocera viscosa TUFC12733]|uniref:Uncharacterized protein n=1 Tax=Calocera viscosa (strain TUFC12733) TaxID=1330018 RepID=A0A167HVF4_CALVF|nr:hypothetical protein CALVIDRAFT_329466 [Calocera viscosa TUFC12733]